MTEMCDLMLPTFPKTSWVGDLFLSKAWWTGAIPAGNGKLAFPRIATEAVLLPIFKEIKDPEEVESFTKILMFLPPVLSAYVKWSFINWGLQNGWAKNYYEIVPKSATSSIYRTVFSSTAGTCKSCKLFYDQRDPKSNVTVESHCFGCPLAPYTGLGCQKRGWSEWINLGDPTELLNEIKQAMRDTYNCPENF